jgi:hypothetical protein
MLRNLTLSAAGVMFVTLAGSVTIISPAHAVVYCKTVGVPQGVSRVERLWPARLLGPARR